jgi:hypothetical protein
MELLHTGWMYHQQKVKELASPVLGAEMTDDEIFHMAVSVAIQDCMALIQQLEAFGYFDEGDEEDELSKPGPAG